MGQGASQQSVWLHISVSEGLGTSPALPERAGEAGGSKHKGSGRWARAQVNKLYGSRSLCLRTHTA